MNYAIIAATVISVIVAYFAGREAGLEKYHKFKAQVEVQQNELRKEIEQQRLVSDGITADVSNAWADALRRDRAARPVVRVLPRPDCDPGKSTTVPDFAGKLGEATAQHGLGEEVSFSTREAEQRLNWCAQDAAQLLLIQNWILKQHEASK